MQFHLISISKDIYNIKAEINKRTDRAKPNSYFQ